MSLANGNEIASPGRHSRHKAVSAAFGDQDLRFGRIALHEQKTMTRESTKIVLHSSAPKLLALIDRAGERAAWRFVEFFTVNIFSSSGSLAVNSASNRDACTGREVLREGLLPDGRD